MPAAVWYTVRQLSIRKFNGLVVERGESKRDLERELARRLTKPQRTGKNIWLSKFLGEISAERLFVDGYLMLPLRA